MFSFFLFRQYLDAVFPLITISGGRTATAFVWSPEIFSRGPTNLDIGSSLYIDFDAPNVYHGKYSGAVSRCSCLSTWKGGDGMSLEAVQKVTETEQKARARKAEAVEQAKKLIADAERQGR